MAEDKDGEKRKPPAPFKRRFSLDIIRAPKYLFRRASTVESQVSSLSNKDIAEEPIEQKHDKHGNVHDAKNDRVFGVLYLENGGHLVISAEDERHLNQLLSKALSEYEVANYRLIIQNIRFSFRVDESSSKKKLESFSPTSDSSFTYPEALAAHYSGEDTPDCGESMGPFSFPGIPNTEVPIQRIADYGPYLEDLLSRTDENSPEYTPLKDALERVNSVIRLGQDDSVDEQMPNDNTTENSEKKPNRVSAIYFKHLSSGSKFRTGPYTQNMGWYGTEGTPDQDRKFIMEGPVQLMTGQTIQSRHMFLLSDYLIIAKEKSSLTYKCKHKIKIGELLMYVAAGTQQSPNSSIPPDRSFIFTWGQNHMLAGFEDSSTKDLWIQKITQQQELYAKMEKTPKKQETDSEEESEMDSNSKSKSKKFGRLFLNKNKRNRDESRTSLEEQSPATPHIFGRDLQDVCTEDKEPHRYILTLLDILFREGPRIPGIFRKSANARTCREIKKEIEEGNPQNLENHNVLAIGSTLKDYLRSLPNSLMSDELLNEWTGIAALNNEEEQIKGVKQLIQEKLPLCHLTLLRYVVAVAHAISVKSDYNKMDPHNIAVCIAPSMLRQHDETNVKETICVTEIMIKNAKEIFGDNIFTRFNHLKHHDSDSDTSMGDPLSRREGSSSVDSLVDISDGQVDDEHESVGTSYSRRVCYERNTSSTDSGLYSQSVESTSSLEVPEPIAPPRKRKEFLTSASFETFFNYPKPNLSNYKIDLSKRLSGDSLRSVEEAREEGINDSSFSSYSRNAENVSRVSPRAKLIHQPAHDDVTPPLSPQSHSLFGSSRHSFTSESSRSIDSLSLQYQDEETYETSYETYDNSSPNKSSNSCSSLITVENSKSLNQPESRHSSPSSQMSSSPIEIPVNSRQTHLYSDETKYTAPPSISVTHCSSSPEEKVTLREKEYQSRTTLNRRSDTRLLDYDTREYQSTTTLNRRSETRLTDYDTRETQSQAIKRSNSFDSLRVGRQPPRSRYDDCYDRRTHVTIISRRLPSNFVTDFVDSLAARSTEDIRRERPSKPPSYQEAIIRKKQFQQPEITSQDLAKQKSESARAKALYQKSLQTYKQEVESKNSSPTSHERFERESSQPGENDIYVTLERTPRQVYEESISLFEKSRHSTQHNNSSHSEPTNPPPYSVAITSTNQTFHDYTQPESIQTPVIVNKPQSILKSTPNVRSPTAGRQATVTRSSSSTTTRTSVISRPRAKPDSDLPWSVSRMREKFDSNADSGPRSPPPYQHPPPFKRSNDSMSISSTSSIGGYSLNRSGPQSVDFSFSSTEDLNSSGTFSHFHEDSADSSDHNYTDVSYV